MPKIGMEPIRRKALIEATIEEIGKVGSLDVTVGMIAKRAGVSSALAHHYFGGKDQIMLAAMRSILTRYRDNILRELRTASTPIDRLEAIITTNFRTENFSSDIIASWLTFYVLAQKSDDAQRLMNVYSNRLQSNLVYNLRELTCLKRAHHIAEGLASIIDGFYLRQALKNKPDTATAIDVVTKYLHSQLKSG